MGFYVRKSVSVGPFRFNLSKSGVGVSAGVKGFRVGTGPRGNYVHIGRGGLYYRATLERPGPGGTNQAPKIPLQTPLETSDSLEEIESLEAERIVDSSSAELVEEMNAKHRRIRLWPIILTAGLAMWLIVLVALDNPPGWLADTIFITSFIGAVVAAWFDRLKKTTVLLFELDEEAEACYQFLHEAYHGLASCRRCWHISAQGAVTDRKRNAGASSLVRRASITLVKKSPPYVKTNISIPSIPVGKQTLYFFPDKVLVFDSSGVGAVSYRHLSIYGSATRFIEEGQVPKDSEIVDTTWRYVNKKGGPDRRFNNNRQIPIVLYEEIDFSSESGLNERIQLSRTGTGQEFQRAIKQLASLVD